MSGFLVPLSREVAMSKTEKVLPGRTQEDKLAVLLAHGWKRYQEVFQTTPHGTAQQLGVLLILAGGPKAIREILCARHAKRKERK